MASQDTTVVIGASPYRRSAAAYLKGRGVPTLVFGKTMEFWQNMFANMYLKLVWTASTFSDPGGTYSVNQYTTSIHSCRKASVPLPDFLGYGQWFQQHAMTEVTRTWFSAFDRRDPLPALGDLVSALQRSRRCAHKQGATG